MLLSRSIRQRAVPRLIQSSSVRTPLAQSRSLFLVPKINEAEQWSTDGIGKLMSAEQFSMAWTENQQRLVDGLNRLTDGTPLSGQTTKQVLEATAREPDQAQLFNYASLAHNNHFYFRTLSSRPTRPSDPFGSALEKAFSSAASLRATFLSSAESMFAPGFVWLVQLTNPPKDAERFAILNTYAAGTPYSSAAHRRQDRGDGGSAATAGVGRLFRTGGRVDRGGIEVVPLMCVSTWEHMYLRDFGVAGKRQYLEAWWDAIDWQKVEAHHTRQEQNPGVSEFLL